MSVDLSVFDNPSGISTNQMWEFGIFSDSYSINSGRIYSQMRHMVGKETFLHRTDESNDLW